MLIEKTFADIIRFVLQQTNTLNAHRIEIGKFEELCAVLRSQGSEFIESIEAEEREINYHMHPAHYGDYLAILDALVSMGAHRMRTGHSCDVINPQPDAPQFWLHIPDKF